MVDTSHKEVCMNPKFKDGIAIAQNIESKLRLAINMKYGYAEWIPDYTLHYSTKYPNITVIPELPELAKIRVKYPDAITAFSHLCDTNPELIQHMKDLNVFHLQDQ